MATFIILAAKCLQIRQKCLLGHFNSQNAKMKNLIYRKNKTHKLAILWARFNGLNSQLNALCGNIDETTTFWKPPVTILILCLIVAQCYLMYIVLFIGTIPLAQKIIPFAAFIQSELALFLLIDQCARVVKWNRAIEHAIRKFCFMSCKWRVVLRIRKDISQILKAETLQSSRRLHCYAFRMFDDYRITSKTFYVVLF